MRSWATKNLMSSLPPRLPRGVYPERDSSVAEFILSRMRFFASLRMTGKAKCSLGMTAGKGLKMTKGSLKMTGDERLRMTIGHELGYLNFDIV